MRLALSYVLIILGIYLLGHAAYQEYRGDTVRPFEYLPFSRRAILDHPNHNSYQFHIHVLKQNNPQLFREFMEAHWVWAIVIEAAGIILNATEYRLPSSETETPA